MGGLMFHGVGHLGSRFLALCPFLPRILQLGNPVIQLGRLPLEAGPDVADSMLNKGGHTCAALLGKCRRTSTPP